MLFTFNRLIFIPIIAILGQVATAKAFSNGCKTDSTQEMIAVGISSIFGSFFGSIPSNHPQRRSRAGKRILLINDFNQTQLNFFYFVYSSVLAVSGGKTQFASAFTGMTSFK